jgi:hypothetical protein
MGIKRGIRGKGGEYEVQNYGLEGFKRNLWLACLLHIVRIIAGIPMAIEDVHFSTFGAVIAIIGRD